mmetsp:Transcript_19264/g.58165  ORF Transcript_19264/g.58165 Transcript_19264/m.58165 type:complete len:281 (+) Transcript_19264:403-1245(+)
MPNPIMELVVVLRPVEWQLVRIQDPHCVEPIGLVHIAILGAVAISFTKIHIVHIALLEDLKQLRIDATWNANDIAIARSRVLRIQAHHAEGRLPELGEVLVGEGLHGGPGGVSPAQLHLRYLRVPQLLVHRVAWAVVVADPAIRAGLAAAGVADHSRHLLWRPLQALPFHIDEVLLAPPEAPIPEVHCLWWCSSCRGGYISSSSDRGASQPVHRRRSLLCRCVPRLESHSCQSHHRGQRSAPRGLMRRCCCWSVRVCLHRNHPVAAVVTRRTHSDECIGS